MIDVHVHQYNCPHLFSSTVTIVCVLSVCILSVCILFVCILSVCILIINVHMYSEYVHCTCTCMYMYVCTCTVNMYMYRFHTLIMLSSIHILNQLLLIITIHEALITLKTITL